MTVQRTIFIGDIHGCFEELQRLLNVVRFRVGVDRLIFVGDLINKGPDSRRVVEFARDHKVECIKGNHELRFIEYVIHQETNRPKWEAIKKEFGSSLSHHLQWLDQLPMFIDDENFTAVHAGLIPDKRPDETNQRILANIRTWDGKGVDLNSSQNPAWHSLYQGSKLVVYGHWAKQGLHITDRSIGLDSGCVYGNYLSALVLPERRVYQVRARRSYCKI